MYLQRRMALALQFFGIQARNDINQVTCPASIRWPQAAFGYLG